MAVGKGWHLSAEEALIFTPREVGRPQRIPSEPCTDSEKSEIPELHSDNELSNIFQLSCGGINDIDGLFELAEEQFGISFTEFAALIAQVNGAILIFDDISKQLVDTLTQPNFDQKFSPVLDFCPTLTIILTSRHKPRGIKSENVVELHALEPFDTRQYLLHHPDATAKLNEYSNAERIHDYTGGLPWHIDRLIERTKYLSLEEIIDEGEYAADSNYPTPEALTRDVGSVSNSLNEVDARSFKLLKVLTVLKDGETFEAIKRLLPTDPFYPIDVDKLISLNLIEPVSVIQPDADFTSKVSTLIQSSHARLLRVPRQVRDYVNTQVDDSEKDDIFDNAANHFFGTRWRSGKITLNSIRAKAKEKSSISGPGNELVVAQFLLQRAKKEEALKRSIVMRIWR